MLRQLVSLAAVAVELCILAILLRAYEADAFEMEPLSAYLALEHEFTRQIWLAAQAVWFVGVCIEVGVP